MTPMLEGQKNAPLSGRLLFLIFIKRMLRFMVNAQTSNVVYRPITH